MKWINKIVVITGAAGGIGQKLSQALLEQGAIVWGWDKTTLPQFPNYPKQSFTAQVDVTDAKQVAEAIEKIKYTHQRIDIFIQNAGTAQAKSFLHQTSDNFETIFAVNFHAAVISTRLVLPMMEEQGGGYLVFMASMAGHIPTPYMTAYAASKHALVGFVRSLQIELEFNQSPVKTLLVSPGFVNTNLIRGGADFDFPQWLNWLVSEPEDLVKEVLSAMETDQQEITPTWNAKLLKAFYRWFPRRTARGSKSLLADSLGSLLLGHYKKI